MFIFTNDKKGRDALFVLSTRPKVSRDVSAIRSAKREPGEERPPVADLDESFRLLCTTEDGDYRFPSGARVFTATGREVKLEDGYFAEGEPGSIDTAVSGKTDDDFRKAVQDEVARQLAAAAVTPGGLKPAPAPTKPAEKPK